MGLYGNALKFGTQWLDPLKTEPRASRGPGLEKWPGGLGISPVMSLYRFPVSQPGRPRSVDLVIDLDATPHISTPP